jgi:hypothetical protein
MEPQLVLMLAASAIAVAAAVYVIPRQLAARRREALRAAALGLGFEFQPELGAPPDDVAGFRIFSHGRAHKLRNVLRGRRGDTTVVVADHHYVTGSGKNHHRHRAALVILRCSRLALPHFFMRPQIAVLDRIGKLLGGKDVDFAEDDAFSAAFVLQGDSEAVVRAAFNSPVRQQALQLGRGVRVEGDGETVLVARARAVPPDETSLLLDRAAAFLEVLAGTRHSSW